MSTNPNGGSVSEKQVAVAIACICGPAHLARCLDALGAQQGSPPFDIVVRYDPAIAGMDDVIAQYPHVQFGCAPHERTPLELAAAALRACDVDVVLLTEDHCVPRADWVRTMVQAVQPGRGAVGGRIEVRRSASAVDWAFYFVDFFRYAGPVDEGPSPTLSVCNVAYDRRQLAAVGDLWHVQFNEPEVHDALRAKFGDLWLHPASEVVMHRAIAFLPCLRERYAFGRIFGYKRIEKESFMRRCVRAAVAPALPALLLGRMTAKVLRSRALARRFAGSLGPILALVFCWSWGEWIGYVTGRPPRTLTLAADLSAPEFQRRLPGNSNRVP